MSKGISIILDGGLILVFLRISFHLIYLYYVLGCKGISGAVTQGLRPVAPKARRPISEHE